MWTKSITLAQSIFLKYEIVLPIVAFMIPFFLSGPELLTGTFVNACLFLHVMSGVKKNRYLTMILPSIGAVSHGVIFGPNTPFLLYFLPSIWLSNYVLMTSYELLEKKLPYPFVIVSSAVIKSLLLYATANLYYVNSWIPSVFMITMGMIQLYTGILGGLCALTVSTISKKYE